MVSELTEWTHISLSRLWNLWSINLESGKKVCSVVTCPLRPSLKKKMFGSNLVVVCKYFKEQASFSMRTKGRHASKLKIYSKIGLEFGIPGADIWD